MGVYSEAAAMQMREAQAVENFKFTDLLEFAVNTERNNQSMFNALLELDFQEAVTVQNGGYLTEADEQKAENKGIAKLKAIGQQIVKTLQKFLDTLGAFWQKFVAKVQDFTGMNKALVKKFGTIIIADAKDALGNADVKFVKYDAKDVFTRPLTKVIGLELEYGESEAVEDALKAINGEDCTVTEEEIKGLFKEVSASEYLSDATYVTNLSKNLTNGYKAQVAEMQKVIVEAQKKTKGEIEKAKKLMNPVSILKNKTPQEEIVKANAKYRIYNAVNAKYMKLLGQALKVAVKKMTVDRAAYVKLGSACKKAKVNSAVDEAAMADYAILEFANEQYMEDLFA